MRIQLTKIVVRLGVAQEVVKTIVVAPWSAPTAGTPAAPRTVTINTSATPTPDLSNTDIYIILALASAATIGAPTGTPVDGQQLCLRITDDGTARALTWNAVYRGSPVTTSGLPSTTIPGETLYPRFLYNVSAGKWDLQAPLTGGAFWTVALGTPVRTGNNTFRVTGDFTNIYRKFLVIKWDDTGVTKWGMVAIPSTYGAPDTTITIIGDTMTNITAGSLKYALMGAEPFTFKFSYAGTVGATGTDVANAEPALEPMKVFGADLAAGTAGTTNNTTIDINKAGTSMFATKPTLASGVAASPTPFSADSGMTIALNERQSMDVDAVQTTKAIDLYAYLYRFPLRYEFF